MAFKWREMALRKGVEERRDLRPNAIRAVGDGLVEELAQPRGDGLKVEFFLP